MIGWIGTGAMGGAILRGVCKTSAVKQTEVCIYDASVEKAAALAAEMSVKAYANCGEMIADCDIILIAIKPNVVSNVLDEYREDLAGKALISIAAGWTTEMLRSRLDPSTRVLRAMPNTPALVGEAMTAFSKSHTLTDEQIALAERIFTSIGKLAYVDEKLINAVIGVSGSGPAYVYMFIEALADGGVFAGLPRAQAMELAAQTLVGSAKMVMESGMHPGALKDMVCSPGGTTIAAVKSLEESGFRASVINAVVAAAKKAEELA